MDESDEVLRIASLLDTHFAERLETVSATVVKKVRDTFALHIFSFFRDNFRYISEAQSAHISFTDHHLFNPMCHFLFRYRNFFFYKYSTPPLISQKLLPIALNGIYLEKDLDIIRLLQFNLFLVQFIIHSLHLPYYSPIHLHPFHPHHHLSLQIHLHLHLLLSQLSIHPFHNLLYPLDRIQMPQVNHLLSLIDLIQLYQVQ